MVEHFTFKVRNKLFGTYFEEDPLILLDGIPIADASKLLRWIHQRSKGLKWSRIIIMSVPLFLRAL